MRCIECGGDKEIQVTDYRPYGMVTTHIECEHCHATGREPCCACGQPSRDECDDVGFPYCSEACRAEDMLPKVAAV